MQWLGWNALFSAASMMALAVRLRMVRKLFSPAPKLAW